MEWADSLIWFSAISLFLSLIFWSKLKNGSSNIQPPGPKGWPIIGNVFNVGTMPHQNLQKLQSKYGPFLWLKLGTVNTLVIQSAEAATELFKKHDLSFSDRRVPDSLTACDYHKGSLAIANYSVYSRTMRRICATELLVHKRIAASAPARQKCIDNMIQWIKEDATESREIQLDRYLVLMTFNLVSNFVLSKDLMDSKSEKGNLFFETMNKYIEWNGKPNLVDSFPLLKWFDPQGIRKNTEIYLQQLLDIIEGFVKERIRDKSLGTGKETKDFLDALLEHEGNGKGALNKLSRKNVTILILEMFFAGTETTSSTIHWAMAELLRNPDTIRKLKAELDSVVNRDSRKVEESDLTEMPYLQAVVKESMRLHPSLPLLLPRNSMQETDFMGYIIPKNTMVLVNAWAIHRDPKAWVDPFSFKPERFLNSSIDSKGQHFELIPFGSGRRSCIGMFLGDRMVSLTIARLIQSFDWDLPFNVSPNNMDMREKMGISLRMLTPLKIIPRQREGCQFSDVRIKK